MGAEGRRFRSLAWLLIKLSWCLSAGEAGVEALTSLQVRFSVVF